MEHGHLSTGRGQMQHYWWIGTCTTRSHCPTDPFDMGHTISLWDLEQCNGMIGLSWTTIISDFTRTKRGELKSGAIGAVAQLRRLWTEQSNCWKSCKCRISFTASRSDGPSFSCDYLPQRYPTMFRKTSVGMDNFITGECFNVIQRPLPEDPMITAGRMVQDDLAIMYEKEDGQYYLLAGSILLAGFWRLADKFGMPLSEIHTSGDVPKFKSKLEKGMMSFFRRIQPQSPVIRNNYFIQVDDELAWSPSIGPEDGEHTQSAGWDTAEKNKAVTNHHFRSERQSLRRLPRSGGVVFTIRTYFEPITKIVQEPGVPGRLASAIRSWGEDTSRYKGRAKYGEVLLDYLDVEHRKQVEAGLTTESMDEDERQNFPF